MTIYTVISFFSDGKEINHNLTRSFQTREAADAYTYELPSAGRHWYEIIENHLN